MDAGRSEDEGRSASHDILVDRWFQYLDRVEECYSMQGRPVNVVFIAKVFSLDVVTVRLNGKR